MLAHGPTMRLVCTDRVCASHACARHVFSCTCVAPLDWLRLAEHALHPLELPACWCSDLQSAAQCRGACARQASRPSAESHCLSLTAPPWPCRLCLCRLTHTRRSLRPVGAVTCISPTMPCNMCSWISSSMGHVPASSGTRSATAVTDGMS